MIMLLCELLQTWTVVLRPTFLYFSVPVHEKKPKNTHTVLRIICKVVSFPCQTKFLHVNVYLGNYEIQHPCIA